MASRQSLVLGAVLVTHMNGSQLPQPVWGRPVFHLRPRFRFSVDLDGVLHWFLPGPGTPCRIRTDSGIEAEGLLIYSLTSVFDPSRVVKASFILKESPTPWCSPTLQLGA